MKRYEITYYTIFETKRVEILRLNEPDFEHVVSKVYQIFSDLGVASENYEIVSIQRIA